MVLDEPRAAQHDEGAAPAVRLTQTRHPFAIDAMVVLPDHIHAV